MKHIVSMIVTSRLLFQYDHLLGERHITGSHLVIIGAACKPGRIERHFERTGIVMLIEQRLNDLTLNINDAQMYHTGNGQRDLTLARSIEWIRIVLIEAKAVGGGDRLYIGLGDGSENRVANSCS